MQQALLHVALLVRDYDEAIAFFTQKLRFTLIEDSDVPEQDKRWVVVRPPGSGGASILLARPSNAEQQAFVGNQTGGRVTFFLATDDFQRDYEAKDGTTRTVTEIEAINVAADLAFATATVKRARRDEVPPPDDSWGLPPGQLKL